MTMKIYQKDILFFSFFFLVQCVHINKKIDKIPFHSVKHEVMSKLGRPFDVRRKESLDHIIYKFKINKQDYTRTLIFKEGKLIRKEKKNPYPSDDDLLNSVENFEDYKQIIQRIQNRRDRLKK